MDIVRKTRQSNSSNCCGVVQQMTEDAGLGSTNDSMPTASNWMFACQSFATTHHGHDETPRERVTLPTSIVPLHNHTSIGQRLQPLPIPGKLPK
ncbi:hypothetical protein S40285_10043 [Stachybotrys chlorohalonatus IBT 40285]|uniref:Uncharacterized protein n=1 Tax=Stachybotrys chlorohalonatus (strain IBT 40285) TaxID=1283841 RepID=A0A084QLT2_STAC4|nr:hypothetical protein S40285_10043 [Stachybotrys chlorohalonata IBT 40285]